MKNSMQNYFNNIHELYMQFDVSKKYYCPSICEKAINLFNVTEDSYEFEEEFLENYDKLINYLDKLEPPCRLE